jgi:hypothetical protein
MTLSTEARTNLNSILTALDEQMQLSENAAYQAALKYNAVLSCFDDISTLTKEATLTAINAKIPSLSNNRIPVELPATNLTADWRILTAGTTTIPAGSCYVYITILTGTVTINGLTKTATNGINDIVNLESCLPARHPAITIIVPEGASVELIRGF